MNLKGKELEVMREERSNLKERIDELQDQLFKSDDLKKAYKKQLKIVEEVTVGQGKQIEYIQEQLTLKTEENALLLA